MELLFPPALLVLFAAVFVLTRRLFDSQARVLGSCFAGWQPDGWPSGVQEEDRDRRWGRARETNGG